MLRKSILGFMKRFWEDKMRILATSNHGNTFNPKEGADVRKHNLIMGLAKHNDVIVLEADRYSCDNIQVPLNIKADYFREYYLFGNPLSFLTDFNPSFISKIINVIRNEKVDLIQISFFYGIVVTKLTTLITRKKIPIIYDAHNVHGDTAKQIPRDEHIWPVRYFLLIYIPILERIVVKYAANHIITVSNEDKTSMIEKYGITEEKLTVIPSGAEIIDLSTLNSKNEDKKRLGIENNKIIILFHGTYSYSPNKEAMDLIIDYIAQIIGKEFKNVLFILAGNGTPIFEKMNVKSIGFVEDLYSLLNIADIAIVPILQGGGTRLKILDYMAFNLPIITTKKGIEGINAKNGEEAVIVDGVNEEFIDAIKYLIDNEQERKGIGSNARKLAEEEYDWNKIGEKLNDLYRGFSEK